MAIDQVSLLKPSRDFADSHKGEGYLKPATIHSKFIPGLGGLKDKMSSSTGAVAIMLNDSEKEIRKKINKHAFSGGHVQVEDQKQYGGDITVDVPYQYLAILEPDDEKLEKIAKDYTSGDLLTGEIKKILGDVVSKLIGEIQERREKIDKETLKLFFTRDREFDLTRKDRPEVELETNETYAGYASQFDVTFGYRCKKTPFEVEQELKEQETKSKSKKVPVPEEEPKPVDSATA